MTRFSNSHRPSPGDAGSAGARPSSEVFAPVRQEVLEALRASARLSETAPESDPRMIILSTTTDQASAEKMLREVYDPSAQRSILHSGGESVLHRIVTPSGELCVAKEFLDGNSFSPRTLRRLENCPRELLPAIGAPHGRALTLVATWMDAQLEGQGIRIKPLPYIVENAAVVISPLLPYPTFEDLSHVGLTRAVAPGMQHGDQLRLWLQQDKLPSPNTVRSWYKDLFDAMERCPLMTAQPSHFLVEAIEPHTLKLILIDLR